MPAPKGHPPYEGAEKGGAYGYLGKPENAWTEEELTDLGKELIDWTKKNKDAIYIKEFFAFRGMLTDKVNYLRNKYPVFAEYYKSAKDILETRWVKYPFYKKADGNHARWIMARHFDDFKGIDLEELPDSILDKQSQLIKEIQAARASRKENNIDG